LPEIYAILVVFKRKESIMITANDVALGVLLVAFIALAMAYQRSLRPPQTGAERQPREPEDYEAHWW
jgi:hypothetical protein